MSVVEELPHGNRSRPRPRFSPTVEPLPLHLPPDQALGPAIDLVRAPNRDLFLLHHGSVSDPGAAATFLPHVVHFTADGDYIRAWGGDDHVPAIDGVSQWPAGPEGLDCDADGNLWLFGYQEGDCAVLNFSPEGELLLRIGQRGRPGHDDDTQFLDRATSCYHDVANREVFVADGYGNHRVIAFNSDTGAFTRMWGAYGEKPSLSSGEGFGNPVHALVRGPEGHIYVGDRIKGRVQEFELVPGGARFLREVVIAPGTTGFGSAFDLAFAPGGSFLHVADGTNHRVWTVDLESFAVLGWASTRTETEGEDNLPAAHGLLHRFTIEPNGDLLLACVTAGFKRMRCSGVS
jgi:hypothetical protein